MRLYNQTRNKLEWSMHWGNHMRDFTVEPFGSLEIPDGLVEHCRARGLPLEVTPMSPEQRATTVAEQAEAEARSDELNRLKSELALAQSAAEEGRKTVERMQLDLSEAKTAKEKAERMREAAEEETRKAKADQAAAEKLLEEKAAELDAAWKKVRVDAAVAAAPSNDQKPEAKPESKKGK